MLLNPALMFMGAAAVSVPIVIHLLNRRKFERVVWAAMRFVQVSVQQNQRRVRIEDLILLLLRCLLVLLLGLALARPAIKAAGAMVGTQQPVTAVVILDNSYSMSQTDGVESRFTKGKRITDQLLRTLPTGSSAAVMLASDTVEPIILEPTYELAYAAGKLHDAELSDRGSDLVPALTQAITTLGKSTNLRKEIFVVTDGQALPWRQMKDIQRMLAEVKGKISTHVFVLGSMESDNVALSDLRQVTPLTVVDQALTYQAEVTNFGRSEARGVQVKLYADAADGRTPPVDEATIDSIPAGGSRSVSLIVKLKTKGLHAITAKLEAARDHLPADDARSMVVRAIEQVQVALVDGDPGREPRDSESFFLQAALQPVPLQMQDQFYIQVRTVTPTGLDDLKWDEYDAVILADVADLSQAATGKLEKFVRDGGGLIVFPGPNVNVNYYNDVLYRQSGLLPASFGDARGDAGQAEKFFTFDGTKLSHPIAARWADPGAGSLAIPRFYRAYDLQTGPIHESAKKLAEIGAAQTVFWYNDGQRAVMERAWGLGRVIEFSSTGSTKWNDLPATGLFVPVLHRSLGSLVARQDAYLNIAVGQKFVMRTGADLLGKDAVFTRPREADKARDSRAVELVGDQPTLTYDRTDLAGIYTATIGGDTANAVKFAARANTEESKLEPMSRDQRTALESVASVVDWGGGMTVQDLVKADQAGAGTELWRYFALAALVLATAETVLAHWFSHSK